MKTVELIIRAVAHHCNIDGADIIGKKRHHKIVYGRQLAMYLIKKYFPVITLKEIGSYFSSRDHSTVAYSIRLMGSFLESKDLIMRNKVYNDILAVHEELARQDIRLTYKIESLQFSESLTSIYPGFTISTSL